jgi:hypothetical protein
MQSTRIAVATLVSLAAAACFSWPASAQDGEARARASGRAIEGYVSDDALQAQYVWGIDTDKLGELEGRAGLFYDDADDLILSGDLLALIGGERAQRDPGLHFRAGTRMYAAWLDPEDEDVFSVGLGGEAEYTFGRDRMFGVVLSAFYAPDIFTFGHTNNIVDATLRFEAEIASGTGLFVGYRSLEFDTDFGDRDLDENLQVGIRHTFSR